MINFKYAVATDYTSDASQILSTHKNYSLAIIAAKKVCDYTTKIAEVNLNARQGDYLDSCEY